MNLNHLMYLQAINKYGSMNKAAKELFVTQPTLTKAIQTLEKELGCPLIMRTATGIALNDFGKVVLQDSLIITNYVEHWRELASKQSASSPVLVQITGAVPRFNLVNNILSVKHKHPELEIHVKYAQSDDNRHPLASPPPRILIQYFVPAHMEMALEYARANGLRLAVLERDEFVLFFNSKNQLASLETITRKDLKSCNLMLYQDPKSFPYINELPGLEYNTGIQLWQDETLIITLLMESNVLAIRPGSIADNNPYFENGSIIRRPLSDVSMPVNLCVFYPIRERITISEKTFIKTLKETCNFECIE